MGNNPFLHENIRTQNNIEKFVYKEKDETVAIILAGTRENFYDELKRYMKSFK